MSENSQSKSDSHVNILPSTRITFHIDTITLQTLMICYSFSQAPEWAEGDVCHMCRVKFSTFQRQVKTF